MTYIFLLAYWLPTWIEGWLDRKGETKKGKVKDTLWLLLGSAILAGVAWCFGQNVLAALSLILMWRVCTFDYIVHWFLKKYSESHKNINVFRYSGKTTHFWDQFVAKIDWRVRVALRLMILLAAIALIVR